MNELTVLDILDTIDGIVDDTHPEGDGCPLCTALDDLREALAATPLASADWTQDPRFQSPEPDENYPEGL